MCFNVLVLGLLTYLRHVCRHFCFMFTQTKPSVHSPHGRSGSEDSGASDETPQPAPRVSRPHRLCNHRSAKQFSERAEEI